MMSKANRRTAGTSPPMGPGTRRMASTRGLSRSLRIAGAFCVVLPACGDDGVGPPATPAALQRVSGDAQAGKAGENLSAPLVVRVTDDQDRPVENAVVTWRVTSGAGEFFVRTGGQQLPRSRTDRYGMSQVYFKPTALGTNTVSAEVTGLAGSPVVFTSEATVMVIRIAYLFGCTGGPSFLLSPVDSSSATVPRGTPVEWTFSEEVVTSCTAHIVSTDGPQHGTRFDSGVLDPGERFRFVAQVVGTWEYEERIHGGTGTLTVVPDDP